MPGRPTRLCTTVIETRIKVAQVIGLVIIRVIQHQRGQSGGHTLTKTFLDAIVTLRLRLLKPVTAIQNFVIVFTTATDVDFVQAIV